MQGPVTVEQRPLSRLLDLLDDEIAKLERP